MGVNHHTLPSFTPLQLPLNRLFLPRKYPSNIPVGSFNDLLSLIRVTFMNMGVGVISWNKNNSPLPRTPPQLWCWWATFCTGYYDFSNLPLEITMRDRGGYWTILQKKRLTLREANGELVTCVQSEVSSQEAGSTEVSIQARRLLWYCLSKDHPRIAPHFLIRYFKSLWDPRSQQSEWLQSSTTNSSVRELLAAYQMPPNLATSL